MRKLTALIVFSFFCMAAMAQQAEFVLVEDGKLRPEMAVASMADIASNTVAAIVVMEAAQVQANTAAAVEAEIDVVWGVVNSLEGVGMIRGYMVDFGVSETLANTNVTATIVKYAHNVSNDVEFVYSDIWTYFNEAPATLPVVRWATSPRENAVWANLESVETELEWVTAAGVQYEAFRSRVKLPIAQEAAFYRVFAEAEQQQVGSYLPVRNGIKVGNHEPLTGEFVVGTNVIKFVGGVRVL